MTRIRGSFIILRRLTFARAAFVWFPYIFITQLDAAAAPLSSVFNHRMLLLLAPCSNSTITLISSRITMIQNCLSRRQNSPYITCAAAGLMVFGGCTVIARGSKAFDFLVLYSILRVY